MIRSGLFLLFSLCLATADDTDPLDGLRTTLTAMRGKSPKDMGKARGATPQLTIAKHQLRDWAESRLRGLPQDGDEAALETRLNSNLRDAKLICGDEKSGQPPCPDWTLLGYVNNLKLSRSGSFLVLRTGVGIECGYDESAYLYGWSAEGWTRVWQSEQNEYTEKAYKPQRLYKVMVSPYSSTNDYLVLTLGSATWCESTLHDVYYRAYRLGPDPQARPLVEGAEWAHIDGDPPIHGSVTANDVLVELTTMNGLRGDSYEAVRHYRIEHDQVKRIDPLALRPVDFVEEWLSSDWKDAALRTEMPNRRTALDWHKKLHTDDGSHVSGELIYPTMHCPGTPDLWQVGVDFSDPSTPIGKEPAQSTYFLVRWRPPYRFTMVSLSDHPSPACMEKDRRADDEFHTLFAGEQR